MLGRIWTYVSNNALVSGLLVLLLGNISLWALVKPAGDWLSADAHVMRGAAVLLLLLLLTAGAVILKQASTVRRLRARPTQVIMPSPIPVVNSRVALVETPRPKTFDPDAFKLTPLRCRALLVLSNRVETRTTLRELHDEVFTYEGRYMETNRSNKGRIQQDMEEAASAGIVRIESVPGGVANYYTLTEQGLKWMLGKEAEFKASALLDMTRYA